MVIICWWSSVYWMEYNKIKNGLRTMKICRPTIKSWWNNLFNNFTPPWIWSNTIGRIWEKKSIKSFFWSVFFCIRTDCGDLRSKSPYSVRMQETTDQKKLHIWTLSTHWDTYYMIYIQALGFRAKTRHQP